MDNIGQNLTELIKLLQQHPAHMKVLKIDWKDSCCQGDDGKPTTMPSIEIEYYEEK